MKKIIIILLALITLTGCHKKEKLKTINCLLREINHDLSFVATINDDDDLTNLIIKSTYIATSSDEIEKYKTIIENEKKQYQTILNSAEMTYIQDDLKSILNIQIDIKKASKTTLQALNKGFGPSLTRYNFQKNIEEVGATCK